MALPDLHDEAGVLAGGKLIEGEQLRPARASKPVHDLNRLPLDEMTAGHEPSGIAVAPQKGFPRVNAVLV
jgi:hypothetical protein